MLEQQIDPRGRVTGNPNAARNGAPLGSATTGPGKEKLFPQSRRITSALRRDGIEAKLVVKKSHRAGVFTEAGMRCMAERPQSNCLRAL